MDVIRTVLTVFVALFVLAGQNGLASPDQIAAGTADPPANAIPLIVICQCAVARRVVAP